MYTIQAYDISSSFRAATTNDETGFTFSIAPGQQFALQALGVWMNDAVLAPTPTTDVPATLDGGGTRVSVSLYYQANDSTWQ